MSLKPNEDEQLGIMWKFLYLLGKHADCGGEGDSDSEAMRKPLVGVPRMTSEIFFDFLTSSPLSAKSVCTGIPFCPQIWGIP